MATISKAEAKKLQEIMCDPIKWSQAFLRSFNPATSQIEP